MIGRHPRNQLTVVASANQHRFPSECPSDCLHNCLVQYGAIQYIKDGPNMPECQNLMPWRRGGLEGGGGGG